MRDLFNLCTAGRKNAHKKKKIKMLTLHFGSTVSAEKFVFLMFGPLIYLHSTFITSDRVIIHGITVGREGMQIHKLFYGRVLTQPSQTSPLGAHVS